MTNPTTVRAGLEPYIPDQDMPWNYRRASHLLRRAQMGAPRTKVMEFLSITPAQAVNTLLSESITLTPLVKPDYDPDDNNPQHRVNYEWMPRFFASGVREKMTLFWSNLTIASLNGYRTSYYYDYLSLLREHAVGNYKEFVRKLGLNTAMIEYLDMDGSHKDGPNENYARELLELFTMGVIDKNGSFNYTETDIKEIARAFTGWQRIGNNDAHRRGEGVVQFNAGRFDNTEKTVFGRTGNWGYDDILDIIFEERTAEIANYICTKLYEFFVYEIPDQSVVDEMALTFIQSNFEVLPVLQRLFTSRHFYEEEALGSKVKSPCEAVIGFMNTVDRRTTDAGDKPEQLKQTRYRLEDAGQYLGSPPDVFGWPENDAWISVQTLSSRWDSMSSLIFGARGFPDYDPIPFVRMIEDHNDPYKLVDELVQMVLAVPVNGYTNEELTEVLLDGIPYYEWSIDTLESAARINSFIVFLSKLPEFQLT